MAKKIDIMICALLALSCFGCSRRTDQQANDRDQFVKIAERLGAKSYVIRGVSLNLVITGGKLSKFTSLPSVQTIHSIRMYDVEIDDCSFFDRFGSVLSLSLNDCQFTGLQSKNVINNVDALKIHQDVHELIPERHDFLEFSRLSYITLFGKRIDEEFVASLLDSNKRILQLVISKTDVKSFGSLRDLPRIERLVIDSDRMDRPTIASLENLTELRNVELSGIRLTGGKFTNKLNQLTMRSVHTDLAFKTYVKGCKNIEWLWVSDVVIEDVGVFTEFNERLIRLSLNNCGITDFSFLAELKSLDRLTLTTDTSIDCERLPPNAYYLSVACKKLINFRSLFGSKISDLKLNLPKPCFEMADLSKIESLESLGLVEGLLSNDEIEKLNTKLGIEIQVLTKLSEFP